MYFLPKIRRVWSRFIKIPFFISLGFVLFSLHPIAFYENSNTECEVLNKKPTDTYLKPAVLGLMPNEDWHFLIERAEALRVDTVLAEDIIACESGGNADAQNPYSSAHGYFQIINSTILETVRNNPQLNLEIGLLLLRDGTEPWKSSSQCWQ